VQTTPPPTTPATAAPTSSTAAPTTTAAPLITKALRLAKSRYAVPSIGALSLGSAIGALQITKRPRRRRPTTLATADAGPPPEDVDEVLS